MAQELTTLTEIAADRQLVAKLRTMIEQELDATPKPSACDVVHAASVLVNIGATLDARYREGVKGGQLRQSGNRST